MLPSALPRPSPRAASPTTRRRREVFWESTGLNGQSTVREVELETGAVLRRKGLPAVGAVNLSGRGPAGLRYNGIEGWGRAAVW